MVTIALDEYGEFEGTLNDGKMFFIGGLVFISADKNGKDRELVRLRDWLDNACTQCGCQYPRYLHIDSQWENLPKAAADANKQQVYTVKNTLTNNLADFISDSAKTTPANGEYRIFCLFGSKKGISAYAGSSFGNLVNDSFGSNRYEHMSFRSVENLLCYTPELSAERNVGLTLATRALSDSYVGPDVSRELDATGHSSWISKKNSKTMYSITNSDSYRARLSSMSAAHPERSLQFDSIDVRPIDYDTMDANTQKDNGFLYLADIICSYIANSVSSCGSLNEAFRKLDKDASSFFGKDICYIYAYDDIDQDYHNAFSYLMDNDLFSALKTIYPYTVNSSSYMRSYYYKHWFSNVLNGIRDNTNPSATILALDKLRKYSESPEYSNTCGTYFMERLEEHLKHQAQNLGASQTDLYHNICFKLYDVQMSCHNHVGNYEEAKKCFEAAKEHSMYANIEDYLELRNRAVTMTLDSGNFEEALEIAKNTMDYEELLFDMRKEIFHNSKLSASVRYGRSASQLGQCYAFTQDYNNANECFETALRHMAGNDIDSKRTMSYYLHSLIEYGKDRALYEKNAALYFGKADVREQYLALWDRNDTHHSFGLFVYVKALCRFYLDTIGDDFLCKFLKWFEKREEQDIVNEHPMEIIYKYLAIIAKKIADNMRNDRQNKKAADNEYDKLAKKFLDKAKSCRGCNTDGLLKDIVDNGKNEYDRCIAARVNFPAFPQTPRDNKDTTNAAKTFTYMYH